MKSRFFLLVLGLFPLFASAREIVLHYEFAAPELLVREGRTALSLSDLPVVGAVGEPRLPVSVRTIALADGEIVTKVSASAEEEGTLDLDAPLEYGRPAVSPEMTDAQRAEVLKLDFPNAAIYASDGPWPAESASSGDVEFVQTYPVVSLRVHPVRYFPRAGRLAFATKMTVVLTCEKSDSAPRSSLRRHVNRRGEVMEKVDNPNDVPRPPLMAAAPTAADYDILFITTASLKPCFGRLFDFYAARNLAVKVLTMEEIDATYTQFNYQHRPDRIRQAVKDVYNESGIRYVVIGGDAGEVPGANLNIAIQNLTGYGPCDQFYGSLEDWSYTESSNGAINTNGATPSWNPTVYVGRYPVRNQAEVDIVVGKVLAHVADTTDCNTAILAGTCLNVRTADNSSKGSYGGNSLDQDWETLTAAGYDVVARFSDRPLAGGKTWNAFNLADAINANDPRILVGMGHGLQQEAFGTKVSSLTNGFWRNKKPFFATSGSCQWCAFHSDDCFGEHIIRMEESGAWGVAGSVWDGWYSYGDESAYSAGLVSRLLQYALDGSRTIGEAFGDAKRDFMSANNTKSTSNCYGASAIVFTLLADPTVSLAVENLRVSPLVASLAFDSSGSTYPSTSFTFKNVSKASESWTLVESPSWLDVASSSGTVPAGGSASVVAKANAGAKNLPCGNNIGYVRFRIGGTTVSRKVNLFVSHSGLSTISATGPATMYRDLPSVWNVSTASSYNGGVSLVGVRGTPSGSAYLESSGSSFAGTIAFSSSGAYRHQMIYHHAGFGNGVGLGAGLIQKIRFRADEGVTFSSVTLRMKHIPWDSWSYPKDKRSTMDDDGFVTVYSRSSSDAHDLLDGAWIEFALDHPFLYDGQQSIVVDLTAQVEVAQSAKKPDKDKDPVVTTKTVFLKTIGSYGYTTRSKTGSSVSASYVTPCASFFISPTLVEPQAVTLVAGAGSVEVTPRATTAASYYMTDGILARSSAAVTPSVRDWRLKWTEAPSGSVEKGAAQSVVVRAEDFSGGLVTAADGVEGTFSDASTGAFIEFAPTATANDLLTRQFTASRVQASYPAALLGGKCRLKSVSIWVEPSIGESVRFDQFTVRAQCRTTGMTNKSYDYLVDGWTTVRATGPFELPTRKGWVEIPFDAPFEYDGVNDFLIDISYVTEQNYNERALIGYCDVGWTSGIYIRTYCNNAAVTPGDPLTWTNDTLPAGANKWAANRWLAIRMNLVDATIASATPTSFMLTNGEWSGSVSPDAAQTSGQSLNLCASFAGAHTAVSTPFSLQSESPIDPPAPIDPPDPTDPIDPVDPTDPVDPIDPVDPTDPTDPVDPTDPIDPNVVVSNWFAVSFTNYPAGTQILDGALDPLDGGAWFLPGADDFAQVVASLFAQFVATNAPLAYRPVSPSKPKADAQILVRVQFSCAEREALSTPPPSNSQAALTVFLDASGAPAYHAWDGVRWVKLVKVVPSDDFVDVKVEFDYANNARLVRYSVDSAILETEDGTTWLPLGGSARYLTGLGAQGLGALGDFSGAYFLRTSPGLLILIK